MAHYTITLKLKTNKKNIRFLDQIFYHGNQLHNHLVKYCRKQLTKLNRDLVYRRAKRKYGVLKRAEETIPKELKDILNQKITYYGLTKANLEAYVKYGRYKCDGYIGADVAQKQVIEVLKGLEKVLYKNGKRLHFRKLMDMNSIEGKKPIANIIFKDGKVSVGQGKKKQFIGVQFPKHNTIERQYLDEAFQPDKIAYCRIKRKMFRGGWHYYLELVMKGVPPKKHKTADNGRAGIDNGTSTVAVVTEDMVLLENLDQGVKPVADKIAVLLQQMDRSRRMTNPQNYNENGMVKKGTKKWVYSRRYRWLRRCLKTLYRKREEGLKQHHEMLANMVLEHACMIYTESADTNALKKRSKKTKKKPDGKFTKKKRFGKSINTYAPAQFIDILDRKLGYQGFQMRKIRTKTFKASQYDHIKQTYQKKELKDRSFLLGDHIRIQRDLYSAFLLMNSKDDLMEIDQTLCEQNFSKFLKLHEKEIAYMKQHTDIYNNPCFGLKDFK